MGDQVHGRGWRGAAELRRWGRRGGLVVRTIPHFKRAGRIVRSSRIRDLLMSGRVETANALLGRPYFFLLKPSSPMMGFRSLYMSCRNAVISLPSM